MLYFEKDILTFNNISWFDIWYLWKKKALTHSHTNRDGWRQNWPFITYLLATNHTILLSYWLLPPLEPISEQYFWHMGLCLSYVALAQPVPLASAGILQGLRKGLLASRHVALGRPSCDLALLLVGAGLRLFPSRIYPSLRMTSHP